MRFVVFGFLNIFLSWSVFAADNRCIDGTPQNQTFTRTLQTSNSILIKEFRAKTAIRTSEAGLGCTTGNCTDKVHPMSLPTQIIEIPKECVKASLKRKVAQTSYECRRKPDGNWNFVKHTSRSKVTPCINDTTAGYLQFVTNKVMACFQGLPLKNGVKEFVDPVVLYSFINNESGFNFSYSYDGGVGLGGLTGSAVQEMNIHHLSRTGGRIQKGRGRYILDSLLGSNNPACQGLKPIIQNDLKFNFSDPRSPNCEWVSLETGIARNLIYAQGYFTFLKHETIGKELKLRAPSAYKDPEILNLLSLIAYGPGGAKRANRALSLIREMRMGSAASINSIKQELKREAYLNATGSKMKEVKRIAGDSCRLL